MSTYQHAADSLNTSSQRTGLHYTPSQLFSIDAFASDLPMAMERLSPVSGYAISQSTAVAPKTPEDHVNLILNGLARVVEAMLRIETEDKAQTQLARILRKLNRFCLGEHFERKLAIHTARKLLELSFVYPTGECGQQHERIMQVSCPRATVVLNCKNCPCAAYPARVRAPGTVEAVWIVVCEEDGASRTVPPDHAKEDATTCSATRVFEPSQHKKDC
jgi:hypothetical protein